MKKFAPSAPFFPAIILLLAVFFLTACSGPSEEKITQAQQAFSQLVVVHNEVVEAHKGIQDDSLDSRLSALALKLQKVEEFHLSEMKDEEIDQLIDTMNSLLSSYQEALKEIDQIKNKEEAAVITPISLTLNNQSDKSLTSLYLYEKGAASSKVDLLEGTSGFSKGQFLTGLMIYRNVSSTPWILEFTDEDGIDSKLELSVDAYALSGESFILSYDAEAQSYLLTAS